MCKMNTNKSAQGRISVDAHPSGQKGEGCGILPEYLHKPVHECKMRILSVPDFRWFSRYDAILRYSMVIYTFQIFFVVKNYTFQ